MLETQMQKQKQMQMVTFSLSTNSANANALQLQCHSFVVISLTRGSLGLLVGRLCWAIMLLHFFLWAYFSPAVLSPVCCFHQLDGSTDFHLSLLGVCTSICYYLGVCTSICCYLVHIGIKLGPGKYFWADNIGYTKRVTTLLGNGIHIGDGGFIWLGFYACLVTHLLVDWGM